jgi:hypothetical protein
MELIDYKLMLGIVYNRWLELRGAYYDLVDQRAAGVEVPTDRIEAVRLNLERALDDFTSICQQAESVITPRRVSEQLSESHSVSAV